VEDGGKELSRNSNAHGANVGEYDLYMGLTLSQAIAVTHGWELGVGGRFEI